MVCFNDLWWNEESPFRAHEKLSSIFECGKQLFEWMWIIYFDWNCLFMFLFVLIWVIFNDHLCAIAGGVFLSNNYDNFLIQSIHKYLMIVDCTALSADWCYKWMKYVRRIVFQHENTRRKNTRMDHDNIPCAIWVLYGFYGALSLYFVFLTRLLFDAFPIDSVDDLLFVFYFVQSTHFKYCFLYHFSPIFIHWSNVYGCCFFSSWRCSVFFSSAPDTVSNNYCDVCICMM